MPGAEHKWRHIVVRDVTADVSNCRRDVGKSNASRCGDRAKLSRRPPESVNGETARMGMAAVCRRCRVRMARHLVNRQSVI